MKEIDHDMMRFLWFENVHDPEPKVAEFRFTRLMFGLRSSPAILGATINHHLEFYKETHPETVKTIKDSLYVDDLVSGAPEDDQAFEIYYNTKRVMSEGGFNLRKWCSNSASLVETINKAETTFESTQKHHSPAVTDESLSYAKATTNPDSNVSRDKCAKFLGSIWDMDSDEFLFDLWSIVDYSRTVGTTLYRMISRQNGSQS
jgi:formylmethanofuran dehydrogenase subunit A